MMRGRMWAKPRTSSCTAWVSSLIIMSRITASLSTVPKFQQIRFHSLEFKTQRFDIGINFGGGAVAILRNKGECASAKKRRQRLDDVVPANDAFVVRRGELVDRPYPQFRGVTCAGLFGAGDLLQFRQCRLRENGLKYRVQLGHTRREHISQPFTIHPQWLQNLLTFGASRRYRLRSGLAAP